jgi:hypothetical protein
MYRFRAQATKELKDNYQGMLQTVWSGAGAFLDEFYGRKPATGPESQTACFRALFDEIKKGSTVQ